MCFNGLPFSPSHSSLDWPPQNTILLNILPSFIASKLLRNKKGIPPQPLQFLPCAFLGLERYCYWVIGYWAIFTDIGQYCYWGIFFRCDTQYNTNQTAVSTVHMPVNDYLVLLVTCTLTDAIVCLDTVLICCCLLNTIIVIIIEF